MKKDDLVTRRNDIAELGDFLAQTTGLEMDPLPAKRKPGRPRKVVVEAPPAAEARLDVPPYPPPPPMPPATTCTHCQKIEKAEAERDAAVESMIEMGKELAILRKLESLVVLTKKLQAMYHRED